MDGAAKMPGQNNGCAVLLQEKAFLAVYNYCANHDLNLVCGKCSKVPEIHSMLDLQKQLETFFEYSPKRCHQFEDCIEQHTTLLQNEKITKKKFKIFYETQWMGKNIVFEDFQKMY